MSIRCQPAFTLLEMMVAIAVLSLMMVFMFGILGQAISGWETGGRRMESAQAARIGMNMIAEELQYAFAGSKANTTGTNTNVFNNIVPFAATTGLPGETSSSLSAVPGSQSLFFVAPLGAYSPDYHGSFGEVGYLCSFVTGKGYENMIGQRYYLLRHGGGSPGYIGIYNSITQFGDFYYRSATPDTNWINNASSAVNRVPIVDNCIRLTFAYASNNAGTVSWTDTWPSQTNLPLGVLVTMLVLDNKSANRLAQLKGDNPLTQAEIDKVTNGSAVTTPADRVLREGTTVVRRFVPLLNSGSP